MASLIENLIWTLEEENQEYKKLLELAKEKTSVIIQGDVAKLNEMTAREQEHTDRLAALVI